MLLDLGYQVHVAVFRAIFRTEREKAAAGEYRRPSCQTTEQDGIIVHRLQPAIRSTSAKEQDYLCDLYSQLKHPTPANTNLIYSMLSSSNETGFLDHLISQGKQHSCDQ